MEMIEIIKETKMKRIEFVQLETALASVGNIVGTIQWTYGVNKNFDKVQSIVNKYPIKKLREEFNAKQKETIEKYALKNPDGSFKITDTNGYVFDKEDTTKDVKVVDMELSKLAIEYKPKFDDIDKFLEEEHEDEVSFHLIEISNVPNGLTPAQLKGISKIIKDF